MSSTKSNGMRGSTVQSISSQYQVKHHQQHLLNKNSSKPSLNFQLPASQQLNSEDMFSSKEIYAINGVTLTNK